MKGREGDPNTEGPGEERDSARGPSASGDPPVGGSGGNQPRRVLRVPQELPGPPRNIWAPLLTPCCLPPPHWLRGEASSAPWRESCQGARQPEPSVLCSAPKNALSSHGVQRPLHEERREGTLCLLPLWGPPRGPHCRPELLPGTASWCRSRGTWRALQASACRAGPGGQA